MIYLENQPSRMHAGMHTQKYVLFTTVCSVLIFDMSPSAVS